MNIDQIAREIMRRKPLPANRRAPHGQWVRPAWVVRKLVEDGWGVKDAVAQVCETLNLHPRDRALNGVRAAYYEVRNKDWAELGETEES